MDAGMLRAHVSARSAGYERNPIAMDKRLGRPVRSARPRAPGATIPDAPGSGAIMPATIDLKMLISRMSGTNRRGLEAAAGQALSRTHYHVEPEHWLYQV